MKTQFDREELYVRKLTLLKKSEENRKSAELLAKSFYYNAATNRWYYSLFQKAKHILNVKECNQIFQDNSHEGTINLLRNEVLKTPVERLELQEFHEIRKYRNKCDYNNTFDINSECYEKNIVTKATDIENILKKYC